MRASSPTLRARGSALRRVGAVSGSILLALWAGLAAASLPMLALGHRPLAIEGTSMQPAIGTGDVVVNQTIAPADARVGDVVTFSAPDVSGMTTHRVVEVERRGGVVEFVTKGDANLAAERWTAAPSARIGRVAYRIPKLGYLLEPSRTALGLLAFAMASALVLAFLLTLIWRPAGAPIGWPVWRLKPHGRPVDKHLLSPNRAR